MNTTNWSTIAALLLSTTQAHAGFGAHGGNVVECQGKPAVVLDYYHASIPTLGKKNPDLVDYSELSAEETIKAVVQRIRDQYLGVFAKQVEDALRKIGPMSDWMQADLKQVDDANEPYLLAATCKRKTAAVRQENVAMYGDPTVISSLSPSQQGLLMVHEALYLLSLNQESSESVRALMRELLPKKIDSQKLRAAVSQLGGSTATTPNLPSCGNDQTSVAERMQNCSLLPESTRISSSGIRWNLVTRSNYERNVFYTDEVWQDSNTGLVWGSDLDTQHTYADTVRFNSEGNVVEEVACQSEEGNRANGGINDLTFSLPTKAQWEKAIADGFVEVVPNRVKLSLFWTASMLPDRGYVWQFYPDSGHASLIPTVAGNLNEPIVSTVLCVGH